MFAGLLLVLHSNVIGFHLYQWRTSSISVLKLSRTTFCMFRWILPCSMHCMRIARICWYVERNPTWSTRKPIRHENTPPLLFHSAYSFFGIYSQPKPFLDRIYWNVMWIFVGRWSYSSDHSGIMVFFAARLSLYPPAWQFAYFGIMSVAYEP